MTHRPTKTHTTLRSSLFALAALALGVTACMDVGSVDDQGAFQASVNCSAVRAWAVGQTFQAGEPVSFDGKAFNTRELIRVDAPDWTPTNLPRYWAEVGNCVGDGAPPVVVNPPPAGGDTGNNGAGNAGGGNAGGGNGNNGGGGTTTSPPTTDNPAFDAVACMKATGINGGAFDQAGDTENVGNANGGQFITGRCLTNDDCASHCCAKPCGICSGPDVGDKAGKTGCGFDISNPFAK